MHGQRGVSLGRSNQRLFVAGRGPDFLGHQEPGADHNAGCAHGAGRQNLFTTADATPQQPRDMDAPPGQASIHKAADFLQPHMT